MPPSIKIDLFMVASDQPPEEDASQIPQPTFAARSRPCSQAAQRGDGADRGGAIRYVKPESVSQIAEEACK